jgi:hypothetical protein
MRATLFKRLAAATTVAMFGGGVWAASAMAALTVTFSNPQPNAGETVTLTVSDSVNTGEYSTSNGIEAFYEPPGNSGQCGASYSDEASRPDANAIFDETFTNVPYSFSGPFTPQQAGQYMLCGYVWNTSNGQPEAGFGPVPFYVYPSSPPTPPGIEIQLVNDRGVPQFGYVVRVSDGASLATDGLGQLTLFAKPGEVFRFTRDLHPSFCSPPEGRGVTFTAPNPATGMRTVTLPNATGDAPERPLSHAEKWVVAEINKQRAKRGEPALTVSTTLSKAARATALELSKEKQPYHWPPPHCDVIAQDWGWPSSSAGAEDAATSSPQKALAHWTDNSGRGRLTFSQGVTDVGIARAKGAFILELGKCPSSSPTASGAQLKARCGIP